MSVISVCESSAQRQISIELSTSPRSVPSPLAIPLSSSSSKMSSFTAATARGVGRNWWRGCFYFPPSSPSLPSPSPPFPSPSPPLPLSFHSPLHSFPLHPLPYPFPSLLLLSRPLRSRALLNQLGSLGERCKLPQRGPVRSPGQKLIWCTLELSKSHWWPWFWVLGGVKN